MKLCIASLIQLITESFPVSSSGHVALFGKLIKSPISDAELYFLHAPTIIILAIFLRNRWWTLLRHPWRCRYIIGRLMVLGICAEVPTALIYGFMQKYPCAGFPLWGGFMITMLLLLSVYVCQKRRTFSSPIAPWQAGIIGVAQGIALLPGISRLGSTYVVGRWLGLSSRMSFLFSLTIAWPIMTADFFKELIAAQSFVPCMTPSLAVCLSIGMLVSYAGLLIMNRIVLREKVWVFGCYMLVPLIIALFYCS
jgi:undecaprenyl-diphosphatase